MCGWAYEGARDAQRAALEGGAGPPDGEEAVELGVGVELEELWICLWARRGLAYRLHELKSSPFRLDSQFLCCGRCVPASQRPSRLTASSSTGIRESQTHGSDRRAEGRRHLEGGRDDERVAAHAVEGVHVLGPPPKADRHLRQQRILAMVSFCRRCQRSLRELLLPRTCQSSWSRQSKCHDKQAHLVGLVLVPVAQRLRRDLRRVDVHGRLLALDSGRCLPMNGRQQQRRGGSSANAACQHCRGRGRFQASDTDMPLSLG